MSGRHGWHLADDLQTFVFHNGSPPTVRTARSIIRGYSFVCADGDLCKCKVHALLYLRAACRPRYLTPHNLLGIEDTRLS